MIGIYKITNMKNGKFYIGQSTNVSLDFSVLNKEDSDYSKSLTLL